MKIRMEQFDAFQAQATEDFIGRLATYLVKEYSDVIVRLPNHTTSVAEMPGVVLRQMIRNGITRARSYGITWEHDLATFVSLMLDFAPNFDEHPLIRRTLSDEREIPESRMDLLSERTSDENWAAVEERYDPGAWNVELFLNDAGEPAGYNQRNGPIILFTPHECPRCAADIDLSKVVEVGHAALCGNCDAVAEVVSVEPLRLTMASNVRGSRNDRWDKRDNDIGDEGGEEIDYVEDGNFEDADFED